MNSRCKDDETGPMRVGYIVELGRLLSCGIGPSLFIDLKYINYGGGKRQLDTMFPWAVEVISRIGNEP